jgi:hypothetical protein
LIRLSGGASFDARGTRITGELLNRILDSVKHTTDGKSILPDALFAEAQFTDDVSFSEADLCGHVTFRRARFAGMADFREARFQGDADFRGSAFQRGAIFRETVFAREAIFNSTRFTGNAIRSSRFIANAIFDDTVFDGDTSFQNADFNRMGCFQRCRFRGQAFFDKTSEERLRFPGSSFPPASSDVDQPREQVSERSREGSVPGDQPPPTIFVGLPLQPEQPAGSSALLDFFTWVLDHQTALLALLGLLIYGIVREAHDAFYSRLGVVAEDVGLTQVLLVARAALGLAVYLAILAALVLLRFLLARWPRRRTAPNETPKALWSPLLFVVGSLVAFTVPLLLFVIGEEEGLDLLRSPDLFNRWLRWSAVVAGVFALMVGFPPFYNFISNLGIRGVTRPRIRGVVLFALYLLALSFLSLVFANRWGELRAQQAEEGKLVHPAPLFGVLSAQARPVCVYWKGGPPKVLEGDLEKPLLYLGQATSTVVLYNYRALSPDLKILRIPAGEVVLNQATPRVKRAQDMKCPLPPTL